MQHVKGYSLLEILVASSISSGAVLGASAFFIHQQWVLHSELERAMLHVELDRVSQQISNQFRRVGYASSKSTAIDVSQTSVGVSFKNEEALFERWGLNYDATAKKLKVCSDKSEVELEIEALCSSVTNFSLFDERLIKISEFETRFNYKVSGALQVQLKANNQNYSAGIALWLVPDNL